MKENIEIAKFRLGMTWTIKESFMTGILIYIIVPLRYFDNLLLGSLHFNIVRNISKVVD